LEHLLRFKNQAASPALVTQQSAAVKLAKRLNLREGLGRAAVFADRALQLDWAANQFLGLVDSELSPLSDPVLNLLCARHGRHGRGCAGGNVVGCSFPGSFELRDSLVDRPGQVRACVLQ
jgi:hypothetical protein